MRSVRVIKVGETDGRPWARGVTDFEAQEQLAAMQVANSSGAKAPQAAFGLINGLPDAAVAKLVPGDVVTATTITVTSSADSYTDETGTKVPTVRSRIMLAGKASKTAAPVATVDW